MKKALLYFILCFGLFDSLDTNAQSWQWAYSAICSGGSTMSEHGSEGYLVTTDPSDGVYIAGYSYSSSICFDTFTFYNSVYPYAAQTVIAKYDVGGNLLWALASNNGSSQPLAITTDANNNLILYGEYFSDSISFGDQLLINAYPNSSCYFLVKFDLNGNVIWARNGCPISPGSTGGSNTSISGGVVTDKANNIYVSNGYSDTTVQIGSYTLANVSPGYDDFFLAKYDASGNVSWAKSFGGNDNDDSYGLTIGAGNNLYLAGNFESSTLTFGSTTLTYSGSYASYGGTTVFLVEFDTSGNPLWAKSSIGNASAVNTIADKDNNVYVGGFIDDTAITFGPYSFNNTHLKQGAFIEKYNSSGDVLWAKALCKMMPTQK